MKTIYYATAFILFTVIVFLVYLIIWVLVLPFDRNRCVSHHYSRFWSRSIFRICPWWKVKVEGLENIEKGKSYIVMSNHQAMLDIPLLYVLPFNFKWVSKREVYKIPIFGTVLWMHGDIAIERGGAASAKKMVSQCDAMLKRGVSVILFPEGTRTKDGKVNRFMPGASILAKKSKVEILPVAINGTFEAFKDGKITTPHTFTVRIMKPISLEEITTLSFNELGEEAERRIQDEHKIIAPQFYTTDNKAPQQ